MKKVNIGEKPVGSGYPTYVIAEVGFNHGGSTELAKKMIEAASRSGADAVKFQTFHASNIALTSAPHYKSIESGQLISKEIHKELANHASNNNIDFLSTPYGTDCVDVLESVGVIAYKIASMDINNLPLLRYTAKTGKPLIISTGMSTLGEIHKAVETIQEAGNDKIVILHCISKYPPDPSEANLEIIPFFEKTFDFPIGYSDHVLGNAVPLASVTLGANLLEKHFTTDKTIPGADHSISADPTELGNLIQDIRIVEKSLGSELAIKNRPDRSEAKLFRRSLYSNVSIPAGTTITKEMIKSVRPGGGLEPDSIDWVVGRVTKKDIAKETELSLEFL